MLLLLVSSLLLRAAGAVEIARASDPLCRRGILSSDLSFCCPLACGQCVYKESEDSVATVHTHSERLRECYPGQRSGETTVRECASNEAPCAIALHLAKAMATAMLESSHHGDNDNALEASRSADETIDTANAVSTEVWALIDEADAHLFEDERIARFAGLHPGSDPPPPAVHDGVRKASAIHSPSTFDLRPPRWTSDGTTSDSESVLTERLDVAARTADLRVQTALRRVASAPAKLRSALASASTLKIQSQRGNMMDVILRNAGDIMSREEVTALSDTDLAILYHDIVDMRLGE